MARPKGSKRLPYVSNLSREHGDTKNRTMLGHVEKKTTLYLTASGIEAIKKIAWLVIPKEHIELNSMSAVIEYSLNRTLLSLQSAQ